MKTKNLAAFLLCVLALIPSGLRAQTNNLTALLQQGLFEEQANRNLDAAIADYQALARQFDKDRQLAATAVFRLGECYRMQGKTNEAALEYQRILRDFSDQTQLATLSRQNLTGMGMTSAPAASAALQTQKDLLAKQVSLAEQDLADAQRLFQTGVVSQDKVRSAEREVLRLKQQLAALDLGRPVLTDLSVPASSEEDQEIQRIQTMIQNSPDLINAPSLGVNGSLTPLENAATHGWLKVATFLLDHGAELNARGGAALAGATKAGNRAMVELLLSRGANVNANQQDTEKNTPLHIAAMNGFQAVVEVLLANKADVNAQTRSGNTPLLLAAQGNNSKIVSLLLDHKADVNMQNNDRETPLSIAAARAQLENVKLLLAAGANPNVLNQDGRTPLSFAAERGSPEMVKMLLGAKADPNAGKLDLPLLCAINNNDVETAELLLQAGAKPSEAGNYDLWRQPGRPGRSGGGFGGGRIGGRIGGLPPNGFGNSARPVTPLWLAISGDQFSMVQLLLKYKADPNDTQTDGQPLLFNALSETNILKTLLDAGAKVDARDPTAKTGDSRVLNWTPLLLAVENNLPATTVEILLKHGANPNARDGAFGQTPLHWIIGWGGSHSPNPMVLELLLDHKAEPNVRNGAGQTPLDELKNQLATRGLAPEQRTMLDECVNLLRQHGALDVLPDWDRITVSRPSASYSSAIFYKGTNDWNQFTLFDLLGVQYDLLTASPSGATRRQSFPYGVLEAEKNSLTFPDFNRIVIHRPPTSGTNWTELKINLARAFDSGDCAANVPLQLGDVVEIPEADHVISEPWAGLTTNVLFALKNCLTRHLQITVNGQTTNITVAPQVKVIMKASQDYYLLRFPPSASGTPESVVRLLEFEPFMIWPVLKDSNLLLASSDLSHVTVKRRDAATGKTREWTVDCSNPNSPPAFWLRDGDVIEVPQKP